MCKSTCFLCPFVFLCVLLSGCQPNLKKAFNQDTWTVVGPNGLDAQDAGTHEADSLYAEGSLVLDSDGNLDAKKSVLTKFFKRDASSDNVSDSFRAATVVWSQTTIATMGAITTALSKISGNPFSGPRSTSVSNGSQDAPLWALKMMSDFDTRLTDIEARARQPPALDPVFIGPLSPEHGPP